MVDRLEQKGLIRRSTSTRDRRARVLDITDEGRVTLARIEPHVDAAQSLMLRGLTEAEAQELRRLLGKAIAACNDLSRAPMRDVASEPDV